MAYHYQPVETPFDCRHLCWFCGEPASQVFEFPRADHVIVDCLHPALSLKTCHECYNFARKAKGTSIWLVRNEVKQSLLRTYQKDLAIGIHWTKQELENSEFAGGNFEGFMRSGWMMYEIARQRVNFSGWSLVVAGANIDELQWQTALSFSFDGVTYPTINEAISHYVKAFSLHRDFFQKVLQHLGQDKFAQAVRFCRLLVDATPDERKAALGQLDNI
ncbi:hypothetical protein [Thalassotalea sp. G2M2-11]|uniref:hypothetical protein n=1 Tax=Thalassotalea sp. G2M2-11 TaxID=2787627 RepID=UPI0019CFB90D|nr:hypothetical protein [Thalassotalea sp. G2M2-11]